MIDRHAGRHSEGHADGQLGRVAQKIEKIQTEAEQETKGYCVVCR